MVVRPVCISLGSSRECVRNMLAQTRGIDASLSDDEDPTGRSKDSAQTNRATSEYAPYVSTGRTCMTTLRFTHPVGPARCA